MYVVIVSIIVPTRVLIALWNQLVILEVSVSTCWLTSRTLSCTIGFEHCAALVIVITRPLRLSVEWLLKINVFAKKHTLSPRSSSYCECWNKPDNKARNGRRPLPWHIWRWTINWVFRSIYDHQWMLYENTETSGTNLIVTSQMPQIGRRHNAVHRCTHPNSKPNKHNNKYTWKQKPKF